VRFVHGDVPDWEPPRSLESPNAFYGGMQSVDLNALTDDQRSAIADMAEHAVAFGDMESQQLLRVVAIGQTLDVAGVLVEMIALEIRNAVGILLWRARTRESLMLGQPVVSISDNLGTEYRPRPGSSSGSEHESAGEIRLVPSPPRDASSLVIEVQSFGSQDTWPAPNRIRTDAVSGPWTFKVDLRQSPESRS
jgi:hypothetical protein